MNDSNIVASLKSELAQRAAILTAINKAVDGRDVSDFELSLPIVRAVADLRADLVANVSMLARQCDLARDAETSLSHMTQERDDWKLAFEEANKALDWAERLGTYGHRM